MRYWKTILVFGLLLLVGGVWGQSPADSLSSPQVARLQEIAEWKNRWDVAREVAVYFLPILGFLLGGLFTYLGIRNRFQKWAEEEITKKASEKVGVDWSIVKSLVDKETRRLSIRQKRIAVINKSVGKRDELLNTLAKAGFDEKNIYFYPLNKIGEFDDNRHDVILIDNFDGSFSEAEMEKVIEDKQAKFKFVVFTNVDVGFYSKYGPKVKVIKNPAYIADNLEQMLL